MLVKRLLYFIGALAVLTSCSTKRNTVVSRAYHNITARYNGYYYSNLNIEEGVYKINRNNKDNFDKILPVFVYPTQEKAKATFTEFDKAIKKSSLCIQKHAIKDKAGNEIPSAGKWIDNNWINIGISHFYKREFFSGLESFEYVARTYTKSKDKYTAMIWMIKANNEVGAVSSSEPIISFLKNEKKLPTKIKNQLPALQADFYMRRGQYSEAAAKLMEASRNSNIFTGISKDKRARYSFIIAQMFEEQKENKRALQYYKRTIKLRPNYDMVFYSKIKMARLLDVKRNNSEKTKKDLLKMSREFKNSDYYDVIFYTLGEIEEKERNTDKAIYYFKRSVQTSTINVSQKALSYLKLGEINFDLANYPPAEAYYDSAVVTLPKEHPNYNNILLRQKTLESLITHIQTIKTEDSLQRIARMSEGERNAFIDKIIAKIEKEEERKLKEKEAILKNNSLPGAQITPIASNIINDPAQGALFYFYNPNVVSFGVADFQKKWGTRKFEDNWRRSNKATVVENLKNPGSDTTNGKAVTTTKTPKNKREDYEKNLPFNDSLITKSNAKIIDAYYLMGSIYKEELNNTKKAEIAFEELNQRFPANKYLVNNYYVLYRMYFADKNKEKSDYYRDKLLQDFPESEFALLIKNPNYAEELNAKKSEVEAFYSTAYQAYIETNYREAISLSNKGIKKFGKNEFLPKFEFIKAMSVGKTVGVDSMEVELKLLVGRYPKSDVAPLAFDILESIKKQKHPELYLKSGEIKINPDTFNVKMDSEHFIIAIVPDEPKVADAFKTNLDAFAVKYYSSKQFNLTSSLFGDKKQLVILKSFTKASEAIGFYDYLMNDKDVFKGDVKKELIDIYAISVDNLPILFKKKNPQAYKQFFDDHYKNMGNEPK